MSQIFSGVTIDVKQYYIQIISVNLRKNNLKNSPLIPAFARTSFNADSEEFLATEFHRKDTEKSVLICG